MTEPAADTGLCLTVSDDRLEVILNVPAEYMSGHEIIPETQEFVKSKSITAEIEIEALQTAVDEARQWH